MPPATCCPFHLYNVKLSMICSGKTLQCSPFSCAQVLSRSQEGSDSYRARMCAVRHSRRLYRRHSYTTTSLQAVVYGSNDHLPSIKIPTAPFQSANSVFCVFSEGISKRSTFQPNRSSVVCRRKTFAQIIAHNAVGHSSPAVKGV